MVSRQLLDELGAILKDDYSFPSQEKELAEIAESLVSYFEILINTRGNKDKYKYENFRDRNN